MAAILTIDLDRLADNWRCFSQNVRAGCRVGAVVKADAYGLGAERVVDRLWREGCRLFFVAHGCEGQGVAQALNGRAADIIVFHGCAQGDEALYQAHGLVPVLNSLLEVQRWGAFAAASGYGPAVCHVDTGMNRLGLSPDEFRALMQTPDLLSSLDLQMFMTHLASADEPEAAQNQQQCALFEALMALRPESLRDVPLSVANSAGVMLGQAFHYDVVRLGIGLYGGLALADPAFPVQSVVTLDAEILQVRDVPLGGRVSYGGSWQAMRASRVATLAIGYADGVLRRPQGQLSEVMPAVAIQGQVVPIVGRVTMDMVMVDVTDLDDVSVQPGLRAEIIGPHLSLDEAARRAETISYEILTSYGRCVQLGRVKRCYVEEGTVT